MDPVLLSRLQFAVAVYFHFLFVPLTLGLGPMIAIMETIYVRTRDEDYKRMAQFWGKLFLINFAVGIVTGITLEFQFGTNWSRYSEYVGDIFGSLLAIEATLTFFLESTFIAVWVFGWNKVKPGTHAAAIWIVAIASNLSGFWYLTANAWMQHPVGYEIRNGRAELSDFLAVITQKFALLEFVHTIGAAWILGGFFVLGVSAWHLLRGQHVAFMRKSFRFAAVWTLIFAVVEIGQGHMSAEILKHTQPAKMAAMESQWETSDNVPMYLILWPDEENETNKIQALKVPSVVSILAGYKKDTVIHGLKEIPEDERPPVIPVFVSFRLMVGMAFLFVALAGLAWWRRKDPERWRWLLHILVYAIPLPYLAIELGWTLAEVGRQPWIVYGLMKTSDGVSPITGAQVLPTLITFIVLYSVLGAIDFWLLITYARKGPEDHGAVATAEGGE